MCYQVMKNNQSKTLETEEKALLTPKHSLNALLGFNSGDIVTLAQKTIHSRSIFIDEKEHNVPEQDI